MKQLNMKTRPDRENKNIKFWRIGIKFNKIFWKRIKGIWISSIRWKTSNRFKK